MGLVLRAALEVGRNRPGRSRTNSGSGWFGNHRFAGLAENAVQARPTLSRREILVDDFNRPVSNATPENALNLVYRRSYAPEGDFATYAHTGLYTPLAPFSYDGLTVGPRMVNTGG